MTITAKFAGNCRKCGGRIEAGEKVDWQRGSGISHAASCPTRSLLDDKPAKEPVSQPGVYENDEGIFIVKWNRPKTNLYAMKLIELDGQAERLNEEDDRVQIDFEYAKGAIFRIGPDDKMPLERAKALTIRYGRCIVCGRHLKAAESVERGIGPVCIKSFGPVL